MPVHVCALAAIAIMLPGQAAPEESAIVVYRSKSLWGLAIGCPVRHEGRELVELGRGKYATIAVEPGDYVLTNRTSSVEVRVQPGKTRYVRCQVKTGFLGGRADLQLVDEASFLEQGADGENIALRLSNEPNEPAQQP
ncbi:DUF2846 domain-containing protein [Sphingomonas baiyangensis]|uniref:DUF2846 domain-containing protein n=1 Tax=Sphingomonas baiyangensis TaxID=2572576 RepID=A0A4U1L120_9SPHN|nr:DUF2846 domain-containing protein [Sphingomonas baiyangensis]TKD50224.1 hypothetical protein FBR43_05235 [Sphingomonas baiyangensis]